MILQQPLCYIQPGNITPFKRSWAELLSYWALWLHVLLVAQFYWCWDFSCNTVLSTPIQRFSQDQLNSQKALQANDRNGGNPTWQRWWAIKDVSEAAGAIICFDLLVCTWNQRQALTAVRACTKLRGDASRQPVGSAAPVGEEQSRHLVKTRMADARNAMTLLTKLLLHPELTTVHKCAENNSKNPDQRVTWVCETLFLSQFSKPGAQMIDRGWLLGVWPRDVIVKISLRL